MGPNLAQGIILNHPHPPHKALSITSSHLLVPDGERRDNKKILQHRTHKFNFHLTHKQTNEKQILPTYYTKAGMCDTIVPECGMELTSSIPKAREVDHQHRMIKRVQASTTKRTGNWDWFLKVILVKSMLSKVYLLIFLSANQKKTVPVQVELGIWKHRKFESRYSIH